jgi:hypothetical protein
MTPGLSPPRGGGELIVGAAPSTGGEPALVVEPEGAGGEGEVGTGA